MEPWYTSYYFVDLFLLGPIELSQCLQQNPSELAKRIKWLVALIIRKEQLAQLYQVILITCSFSENYF